MKRKSKTIIVISAVFIAGVITGVCGGAFFAHQRIKSFRKMGHEQRREIMMKRVFEKLDLTEDQKSQVAALIDSIQQVTTSQRSQCKAIFREQKMLIEADEFDEAAYRINLQKVAVLKEDMAVKQALIKREIHALLNEKQKKLMDKYFKKLKGPFGHRRPHHEKDITPEAIPER